MALAFPGVGALWGGMMFIDSVTPRVDARELRVNAQFDIWEKIENEKKWKAEQRLAWMRWVKASQMRELRASQFQLIFNPTASQVEQAQAQSLTLPSIPLPSINLSPPAEGVLVVPEFLIK